MFYPMDHWDPFDALERLFSMWDPRFVGSPWPVMPSLPRLSVQQGAQEIVIRVEVPGISPEDLNVIVNDNVLTIRAIRRSMETGGTGTEDSSASGVVSFERSFTLPSSVNPDGVKARYHQGVLEIHIPNEQRPTGRQIPIDLE